MSRVMRFVASHTSSWCHKSHSNVKTCAKLQIYSTVALVAKETPKTEALQSMQNKFSLTQTEAGPSRAMLCLPGGFCTAPAAPATNPADKSTGELGQFVPQQSTYAKACAEAICATLSACPCSSGLSHRVFVTTIAHSN